MRISKGGNAMNFADIWKDAPASLAQLEITGLTDDSRRVTEGFVFVAIQGAVQDGHCYVSAALERGASIVVVQRDMGVERQLILPDTHSAFAQMCAAYFGYPARQLKIIGITGTNGKTTISYLMKSILEAAGYKVGLIGTIQNMVGQKTLPSHNTTPGIYELNSLFDLMRKAGCTYAVMEVSSHALNQGRVDGLTFEVGLFTNLTQDHLDYHGTMENYMLAKKKLFFMSRAAVLNADDAWVGRLAQGLQVPTYYYSLRQAADFVAKDIEFRPDGVNFSVVHGEASAPVCLKTAGEFSVYNALCAAACATVLGFPLELTCRALSALPGVKGRAEVVPSGRNFTLVIDYAHTPDGLENILKTFRALPKNRLVVVFGCGGDRDRTKRPKMGAIAAKLADFCVVTSDNPRSENPGRIIQDIVAGMQDSETPYVVEENRIHAIHYAVTHAQPGDIVVFAGKGHETYQILSTGTIHLDEREVIADALATLKEKDC